MASQIAPLSIICVPRVTQRRVSCFDCRRAFASVQTRLPAQGQMLN
jgi:hypothetical protein